MFDFAAAANEAAKVTKDMGEVQAFEDRKFELPVEGLARLRFIEYIELGTFQEEYQGKPKTVEKVRLAFELSGPKYPPITLEDGTKIPHVIGFTTNKSFRDKSKFPKLFRAMNYDKSATHMAQLLGKSYLGRVVHKASKADPLKIYANLHDDSGFTIRSPHYENPETGEVSIVEAAPMISPVRLFIWQTATKAMWDSIFIDGMWPDKKDEDGNVIKAGTSKNYFQNLIKTALDYKGSPASELCLGDIDIPDQPPVERSEANVQASAEVKAGASADPLAGI